MRRQALVLLLALSAATLTGCGNKGPLQLPAARPVANPPAATPAAPAVATSTSTPHTQH